MRAAVGDYTDLAAGLSVKDRWRECCPRGFELECEPVQVFLPIFGALAVARFLVVAGTASEVSRQRVLGTGYRAVTNAIAIDEAIKL